MVQLDYNNSNFRSSLSVPPWIHFFQLTTILHNSPYSSNFLPGCPSHSLFSALSCLSCFDLFPWGKVFIIPPVKESGMKPVFLPHGTQTQNLSVRSDSACSVVHVQYHQEIFMLLTCHRPASHLLQQLNMRRITCKQYLTLVYPFLLWSDSREDYKTGSPRKWTLCCVLNNLRSRALIHKE